MLTNYYSTRQIYLPETTNYKNFVVQEGGHTEQLWTVDNRIRLLQNIGCWDKLDQYVDARFGVTYNSQNYLIRGYSLRNQSTTLFNGGETNGPPLWVRNAGSLGNQAIFDSTPYNTVTRMGTLSISKIQDYTIGVRLCPTTNSGQQMLGCRYNPAPAQDYWLTVDTGTFAYVRNDSTGFTNAGAPLNLPINQWYFLWIVKDSTGLKFYVNDQLISSNPVTFDMPTVNFYIGGEPGYGAQPMLWQSCFRASQALTLEQRNALQL